MSTVDPEQTREDSVGAGRDDSPARPPEERLLPGARVANRYRIVSLLGRGGMGEVYRADDLKLGQAVALKFLPSELQRHPDFLRRLLDEAKLARQVSHPNVCRVYDVGEWEGSHFLSMEYIDGEDLASLIRRIGYLPRQKALDIARQLCAGLDAAHQLGILHRDLKPANVMLDGRGRVRITDFGLAVAASILEGREAHAGTPAYMAPEQLEGREATARSDIYALGLVLYELFTGRRAFPADTLERLRRLHEDSSPTHPSQIVEGFDPTVEHAILRCLERDAALRPASARDVALLLPGGDPLAAAVARGETPSPDIVAASGPEGTLSPAIAFSVFGATVVMLVVLMALSDRASIIGWVAWPKSAAVLEDNARAVLARLGYDERPADRAHQFLTNGRWLNYVGNHDVSSRRWDRLRQPRQFGMMYFYRQSPYLFVPQRWDGVVSPNDPSPHSREAVVVTDLRGRLIAMVANPPFATPPAESRTRFDWSPLFREAGLDVAGFQPTAPTINPAIASNERAAWIGVLDDSGGESVRVEAAAHDGKPVYFELVLPWDPYWDPSNLPVGRRAFRPSVTSFILLFAVILTVVLAVRNWISGKGDRHGALRVAAAVLVLRLLVWIVGGHHVPSFAAEWRLLLIALGKSLTDAAAIWCFYLALEPYARRLHPRLLVSWTRLLRNRLRDPLVGRDVLCGVAAATLVILVWAQLYVVLPHWLGMSAPPPPVANPWGSPPYFHLLTTPPPRPLLGGRYVLEAFPGVALSALGIVVIMMMLLLGLHLVLRKGWAAVVAVLAIVAAGAWPSGLSDYSAIGVACSLAGGAAMLWSLRFGLLGAVTIWVCLYLWMDFPVTANVNVPHFGTGLLAPLLIAGLGLYGALTASRPLATVTPTR